MAEVRENGFRVSIIPHTGEETTLLARRTGDMVNLETDIIAKYVERLMLPQEPEKKRSGIDLEFLRENGF